MTAECRTWPVAAVNLTSIAFDPTETEAKPGVDLAKREFAGDVTGRTVDPAPTQKK